MRKKFNIEQLKEVFTNVRTAESHDNTTRYIISADKGDISEIFFFNKHSHEIRIFIDNFPGQKKEFSTNIPFETFKEFQDKLLSLGLELVNEERLTTTNSEIGSHHWFSTLIARHLHTGELLKEDNHGVPVSTQKIWMEDLYQTSKELIRGFKFINNP